MSLDLHVPEQNPPTGVVGTSVKPITDGEKVTIVDDKETGGFWSGLDDLGGNVLNGLGNLAAAIADREADRISTGPEASPDRTGDPYDQPGRVERPRQDSFFERHKTELLIGGGVAALVLVVLMVRK